MDFKEAKQIIENELDGTVINACETDDKFICQVGPKGYKNNDLNDSLYSIDKKTKKVSSYSIANNPKEYNSAKLIYTI